MGPPTTESARETVQVKQHGVMVVPVIQRAVHLAP